MGNSTADLSVSGNREIVGETLHTALEAALRLLHPFAPFVSEALWQIQRTGSCDVENTSAPTIMLAEWPNGDRLTQLRDVEAEREMDVLLGALRGVRSLKKRTSEMGLGQESTAEIAICPESPRDARTLRTYLEPLRAQCKTPDLALVEDARAGEHLASKSLVYSVPGSLRIYLALETDAHTRQRIEKEITRSEKRGRKLRKKLEKARAVAQRSAMNPDRVPAHICEAQARDALDMERSLAASEQSERTLRGLLEGN